MEDTMKCICRNKKLLKYVRGILSMILYFADIITITMN